MTPQTKEYFMRRPTLFRTASAILAAALFSVSSALQASGGDDFMENVFSPQYHVPVPELQDYAGGKLGIVAPTYWRVYHFLAYRALTGHPLSKAELAKLNVQGFRVGEEVGGFDYSYSEDRNGVDTWLKARSAVRGAAPTKVRVDTDVGDFSMIINCPVDAFNRASKTLAQRIEQGGQQWAAVWLANQDAVFANCGPEMDQATRNAAPLVRPLTLPPPLPAKAPAWLHKDYAYQRAAAHFYAGRYDQARTQFLAIAGDAASPWQPLGKYLAARALIRSAATLPGIAESEDDKRLLRERLGKARIEMVALARDYAPAQRLVDWLDIRVRPEERRRELSAALAVDAVGASTPQMVTDYLFLMDKLEGSMVGAADPMTAWIGVMQASGVDRYSERDDNEVSTRRRAALDVARAHWEKKREPVWLLALVTNARKDDLKSAERKAAAAVKTDSPAFVAIQYHLARLALAEGRTKDADATVSALLKSPIATSARNRLLRLKMVTAPNADTSLAAAARTPAERESAVPVPDEGKPQTAAPMFDTDLQAHIEQHFPLTTLVRLKPALPASEQATVADLIWTRAVLLGQYAIADGLTDEVARKRATTRHLYERYKKAATPEAKREAAHLILANAPELAPRVSRDDRTSFGSHYWTCNVIDTGDDGLDAVPPAFLSAEERAQVDKEKAQLLTLAKRSAYLIPIVIDWARKNKADPEVPKALHFLIASTRNECGSGAESDKTRNYSKEAFEFLHRHYPKNEWTAKTRYYY